MAPIAQTSAREIHEAKQGYGAAIRRGLTETGADLICICEADGTFEPADVWKLLAYTDENHGYGNVGTDDPPAQSPLDSRPDPGNGKPDLSDAAFTTAAGDSRFSDSGAGHVDNYSDPSREDDQWRFDFDCLTFDVKPA